MWEALVRQQHTTTRLYRTPVSQCITRAYSCLILLTLVDVHCGMPWWHATCLLLLQARRVSVAAAVLAVVNGRRQYLPLLCATASAPLRAARLCGDGARSLSVHQPVVQAEFARCLPSKHLRTSGISKFCILSRAHNTERCSMARSRPHNLYCG